MDLLMLPLGFLGLTWRLFLRETANKNSKGSTNQRGFAISCPTNEISSMCCHIPKQILLRRFEITEAILLDILNILRELNHPNVPV